jgi:Xaa-Pro dipeptidase
MPAPIAPHGPDFSAGEYRQRYARLQSRLQAEGIEALVASAKLHLRYLTGYRSPFWDMAGDIQLAILPAGSSEPVVILPRGYEFTAGSACLGRVEYFGGGQAPPRESAVSLAAAILHDLGLARAKLGLDLDVGSLENMPPAAFDELRANLPKAEFVNAYPVILALRAVKSPAELEAVRQATRASALGLQAAFGQIRVGMTKREFGELMCRTMLEQVGESCHMRQWLFFLGTGPDMPTWCNFAATSYAFQPGDIIVADGGCSYQGYCADMMRWGSIGEPRPEVRYMLDVATAAMEAGKAVVRAGVTDGQVDAAMRRVIEQSRIDRDEWVMAGFSGHGIGLEVHELPRLLRDGTTVLEPGMTLSVEPLLLKQTGGRFARVPGAWMDGTPPDMIVMEDNVIVTETGHELLSPLPAGPWIGS